MSIDILYGVLGLSFWGYALAVFITVQLTVLSVTLYLHRDQAHRGVDLHPAVRHFCRFWLWLTTGIVTREWVAVHRKHHARCETEDDPHSPKVYGLKRVLLEGAELYQAEADKPETVEKYGRGTPDDWLERNIYRHSNWGIFFCVVTFLVLFGVPGIIMIAIQMASQPLMAAGIVNGLGHHSGYRNFECDDAATNVVPWGVLLGGEELHNNHHAFPSSCRFSIRKWEFDIGWQAIRLLRLLGLAKVRREAPEAPKLESAPREAIDLETARAILVNRMHVLRAYARSVTLPTLKMELPKIRGRGLRLPRRPGKLMIRAPKLLDDRARQRLGEILDANASLKTVHEFRERLRALWDHRKVTSNDRLIAQLKEWCAQAEASGIKALQDFARQLQGYRMAGAPA